MNTLAPLLAVSYASAAKRKQCAPSLPVLLPVYSPALFALVKVAHCHAITATWLMTAMGVFEVDV
jgi:hypothetical protein